MLNGDLFSMVLVAANEPTRQPVKQVVNAQTVPQLVNEQKKQTAQLANDATQLQQQMEQLVNEQAHPPPSQLPKPPHPFPQPPIHPIPPPNSPLS